MWGIDVKGENGIPGNCVDELCNYNMDWDRPVNFSYISPTEGMLFNQDVNIAVSVEQDLRRTEPLRLFVLPAETLHSQQGSRCA